MLVDPTFYMNVAQNESSYNNGLYVLLGVGCLVFIVGLFGCCGAYKESQCMLVMFFCLLLVIVVGEIAGGTWAWNHSDQLEEMIRESVKRTVQTEYGKYDTRTVTFDAIQSGLHCCGASGPSDWAGSIYNTGEKSTVDLSISSLLPVVFQIPASCCKEPGQLCETSRSIGKAAAIAGVIYSEGCVDKVIGVLHAYEKVVGGIIIGLAITQVLGLIFSIILCCAVRAIDRYKA
ncbi:hypothetical protein J437_LFUL010370 [Ladona fulva]|uniref:Tetraspanin n=1 Tax=Ladona fulva TaxID=123851 RepID=A0A8K0KDZ1_LADFU|nr:hypothetical protein J437_LFUL010370 [Ladona fulva]